VHWRDSLVEGDAMRGEDRRGIGVHTMRVPDVTESTEFARINGCSASGWSSAMAFRLRVIAVEYDSFGETVLAGVLEAGQIGGEDPIRVPTANGTLFQSVVLSMEGPGPEPPRFRAEKVGNATYCRHRRHSAEEGRRRSLCCGGVVDAR